MRRRRRKGDRDEFLKQLCGSREDPRLEVS
jgi:hypothetical protein